MYRYSDDHEARFPEKLELLLPQYTTDPKAIMVNYPGNPNPTPYIYYAGFKETQEPKVILFHTRKLDEDNRMVGFSDGSASQLSEEEFQKLIAAQKPAAAESDRK